MDDASDAHSSRARSPRRVTNDGIPDDRDPHRDGRGGGGRADARVRRRRLGHADGALLRHPVRTGADGRGHHPDGDRGHRPASSRRPPGDQLEGHHAHGGLGRALHAGRELAPRVARPRSPRKVHRAGGARVLDRPDGRLALRRGEEGVDERRRRRVLRRADCIHEPRQPARHGLPPVRPGYRRDQPRQLHRLLRRHPRRADRDDGLRRPDRPRRVM